MVYTAKKKKKKAEEMRVFLHEECVIFTKSTLEFSDTKSGSRDAQPNPQHQQNYQHVEHIKVCNVCLRACVGVSMRVAILILHEIIFFACLLSYRLAACYLRRQLRRGNPRRSLVWLRTKLDQTENSFYR